jgi:type IV pilus assembly protein PilE
MKKNIKGFTFIEMMIAVLILGILTSIAYPAYLRSVMKSNRTDARSELMDFQQRIQRCFTTNGTYVTGATAKCQVLDDLETGVATRAGMYMVQVSDISATGFTLSATGISKQADDKDCYVFSVNQAGVKTARNKSGVDSTAACW